jgi:septal ring factor EnvC (AmiA/AmiB activator)
MIRFNKTTLLILIAAVSVWGCARSNPTEGREAIRIRALEAKIAKLEEDVQAMQAARDHLRQKVDGLEKERIQTAHTLQALTGERNDLRRQISVRTTERDTVQAQYDNFRKEIRSLLGQADAAATQTTGQPITAITPPPPTPGKF